MSLNRSRSKNFFIGTPSPQSIRNRTGRPSVKPTQRPVAICCHQAYWQLRIHFCDQLNQFINLVEILSDEFQKSFAVGVSVFFVERGQFVGPKN